jgi:type IV secretory pathway VirB2 component (pilin)
MNVRNLIQQAKNAMSFKIEKRHTTMALMAVVGVMALTPELAMAAPWDSTATKVLEIFTGGLTRTLAIIAVIACGIAAVAGKLSWDWAIKIIVGIVLIFGATSIVDYVISSAAA